MKKRTLKVLAAIVLLGGCCWWRLGASQAQGTIDFIRDVQPILQTHCAPCHLNGQAKGELRLDDKTAALRGGISGAVIIPGKGKDSRLVHRLLGLGEEKRMPLGGKPLAPEQIALIQRWIDEGAHWSQSASVTSSPQPATKPHWAFVPPVRADLPVTKNKIWAKNAIDAFVLARLEKEGLAPSPAADRATLLRRLSLDLIGLPPTPEEVNAFVKDTSPRAYEKQVDRLLASPHYGERWAQMWLDAARYADSDGFEKDKPREVWFWRDWVINALNRDLPYDQFIIQQIAGDLLPNPTQEQRVATGFLRNSMVNEEGGIHPEQFRMEAMFDRMDAIGKGVLGLTIQCAQCHNHKFDPLKQEEYYRLFAFLNNSYEGALAVYTPEEEMRRANVLTQTRELEAKLQELQPDWLAQMNAWEDRVKNDQPVWQIVQPEVDDISTGGARYMLQPDGSIVVGGYAPVKHRVMLLLKSEVRNITAFRLELLTDPDLPLNGPGRSYKGSCALTEFEVEEAGKEGDKSKPVKLKLAEATADVNPPEQELEAKFNDLSGRRRVTGPASYAIDGKTETGWSIDVGPGLRNQSRKAVFKLAQPYANEQGKTLAIYLNQSHGGWNNNDNEQQGLGRFRLSITTASNAVADPLPANVRTIFAIPREQRTKAQIETVFSYWRTTVAQWKEYNAQLAALWQQYPEGTSQLVMNERAEMRDTFTLKRGDFLRPDKKIMPGVPSFLHPLPSGTEPNRLAFAKWLVARESPTTARSQVNRIWQNYFGTGLLATSEDFGRQADTPSHPELLDWLAVELMQPEGGSAWSLKHIHRLIVTSATYQQASTITPELLEKDPANRLLARGPRLRVDAEIVRDIALATSGLLNPKVGGRSVFPPAPEFIFLPPASFGTKTWKVETGADRYRRALYTFRFRTTPYPMLQAFDAPNGDAACVRRAKSNTPLQALTVLNETLFVEAARALALKTLKEGGANDAQRMNFAFRRVLSRQPTQQEVNELTALLNKQFIRFTNGELNPWNLATNDPEKPFVLPTGVTMPQLAAWTVVTRVLLNLDETITKS